MNGSGHSPKKLTIDHVRARGVKGSSIPLTDLNSVTVPGKDVQDIHSYGCSLYYVQVLLRLGSMLSKGLVVGM